MYKNLYNISIEHFIKIRLHIGHQNKNLNIKAAAYIYGKRHNVSIFNIEKVWKAYRYLYYSLAETIFKRSSFFIVATNTNLPMQKIINKFAEEYPLKINGYNSYYLTGYVLNKWVGGLFSNYKIMINFIQYMKNSPKRYSRRYRKYLNYLKGVQNLKRKILPDFVLMLYPNEDALKEIQRLNIPIWGLVDSNMNPGWFLYQFFGNDDSLESLEFFCEFLKDAILEGRIKEQEIFFYYLLNKLKKKIKKNEKLI